MITAKNNPRLKRIAALLKSASKRREEKAFVIEGIKMYTEAFLQCPERLQEVYVTSEAEKELGAKGLLGKYEILSDECFSHVANTVTPQGVLAVVSMPGYTIDELVSEKPVKLLLLDDVRDPGNLGTIIRTAEAAGHSVILSGESVDITNPKVVRSTMGAIFRVPYLYAGSLTETIGVLKEKVCGIKVYASALDESAESYKKTDFSGSTATVIGNESRGVSAEVIAAADAKVYIPMKGKTESLNAAVAAAILMYEAGKFSA